MEEHLQAEYLLFLDNDTQMNPTPCANSSRRLTGMRGSVCRPKGVPEKGDSRLLSAGGMNFNPYTGGLRDVAGGDIDRGQYDRSRDVQAGPGFAFLVRRAVYQKIGLFDETFNPYGWEDVDFSLRAGEAGFRIVYAPKAVVYHSGGRVGGHDPSLRLEQGQEYGVLRAAAYHDSPVGVFSLPLPRPCLRESDEGGLER